MNVSIAWVVCVFVFNVLFVSVGGCGGFMVDKDFGIFAFFHIKSRSAQWGDAVIGYAVLFINLALLFAGVLLVAPLDELLFALPLAECGARASSHRRGSFVLDSRRKSGGGQSEVGPIKTTELLTTA